MHGTSYNPLVRLISQLKIEYYYDDGSPLYFIEFGPAGPNFKATNVAEEFMDYLRYWLQKNPEGPDCSVEEHIRRFVLQHELISNDEKLWAPEAMRIVENTLGLSLDQISSMFLNEMLPPSRDLYVKGGYDKVIDFVAQPIVQSSGALRRYLDVQRIDWDRSQDDTPVVVHALDSNTGTSLTIEGDAVIVTVPLGVLHLNKLQFQPPLPDDLVLGMSKVSYGALGKVIFHFSDVFWSKHNDTLIYFPTPAALADDSESHRYPVLSHCFVATNL
jgi:polyamine oxidase